MSAHQSEKRRKRGVKSAVEPMGLRPRRSRHGRVMVGSALAGSADDRPSPYVVVTPAKIRKTVKLNPATDEYEPHIDVLAEAVTRPMTAAEVQEARAKVLRATSPTGTYGDKNELPKKAGQK